MVEGLKEQLSPRSVSHPHEAEPVEPLPPPQAASDIPPQPETALKPWPLQQALPEQLRERMSTLIQGSAEVGAVNPLR